LTGDLGADSQKGLWEMLSRKLESPAPTAESADQIFDQQRLLKSAAKDQSLPASKHFHQQVQSSQALQIIKCGYFE
jgi:hypothetical protein